MTIRTKIIILGVPPALVVLYLAVNLLPGYSAGAARIALFIITAGVLASVFISMQLCRSILGRLKHIRSDISAIIESRDFSKRLEGQDADEIGAIAKAFNSLLDTASQSLATCEYLSITDSLTQIYNRLKFNEFLKAELQRARRYKTPLSLILFDIDNFKQINDTYGHLAGDTVLKELVRIVKGRLRNTDIFARWGGEEFVVLTTDTRLDGAHVLAEKIRIDIEQAQFSEAGKVTCSFGIAEFKENDTTDTLSKKSDDALYEAKRSGKNRACISGEFTDAANDAG